MQHVFAAMDKIVAALSHLQSTHPNPMTYAGRDIVQMIQADLAQAREEWAAVQVEHDPGVAHDVPKRKYQKRA